MTLAPLTLASSSQSPTASTQAVASPAPSLARRCERMNPSVLREILKVSERPDVISLAGGLPNPALFPVDAIRAAADRVLSTTAAEALQYAPSEGFRPLREWIAARLAADGLQVGAEQVLVTNGSQQGLDLLARILIDAGNGVQVESPTYLGALQAFTPFEPAFQSLAADAEGPLPESLAGRGDGASPARFAYLVPNFQNPSGRTISAPRRGALARAAQASGRWLVEDNPYGELWYDAAPPAPIAALAPDHTLYLGSLSKVLAPGLRVGYVVAPPALFPKLLQAKQAADLHTAGLTQRIAFEAISSGLLEHHLPTVRARYRDQRDAMAQSLQRHLEGLADWTIPAGGMFFWLQLKAPIDTISLFDDAAKAGVAFVPGQAFFIEGGETTAAAWQRRTLRLSFVTASPEQIDRGLALLAAVIRQRLAGTSGVAAA